MWRHRVQSLSIPGKSSCPYNNILMLLWSAAGLLQMETKTISTAELLHHTPSLPAVSYSETITQRQKAQYSSMVKKTIFLYVWPFSVIMSCCPFSPSPRQSQSSLQCCKKKCLRTSEPITHFASLACLSQCVKNINTQTSLAQVHTAARVATHVLY